MSVDATPTHIEKREMKVAVPSISQAISLKPGTFPPLCNPVLNVFRLSFNFAL